jgi:hypothetical protein
MTTSEESSLYRKKQVDGDVMTVGLVRGEGGRNRIVVAFED